jgi:RNA polymerase sigma-70 factor (ECF subfamily)
VTSTTLNTEISPAQAPQTILSVDARAARERELMERILQGESELFYELVQPYERAVFRSAVAILGNDADAEEVAQEAMLKALTHLPGFRRESKFSTWLIQIAINEAKAKLRKDRRSLYDSIDAGKPSDDGDYIPMELADWREIPSEALEQKELREALNAALQSLPEKYRIVLLLRDIQQISITETAQILGLTEENVKTRTSRARLQMRDLLAPGWGGAWSKSKEPKRHARYRVNAAASAAPAAAD